MLQARWVVTTIMEHAALLAMLVRKGNVMRSQSVRKGHQKHTDGIVQVAQQAAKELGLVTAARAQHESMSQS